MLHCVQGVVDNFKRRKGVQDGFYEDSDVSACYNTHFTLKMNIHALTSHSQQECGGDGNTVFNSSMEAEEDRPHTKNNRSMNNTEN